MRCCRCFSFAILLTVLAAMPAGAQEMGFYPVEDLGILDPGSLEVDVNLEGAGIQIALGAMHDQDQRLRDLVSELSRVRVQVGSAKGLDPDLVFDRIDQAKADLEAHGWNRMIQVEEGSSKVYLFSMDAGGGMIAGLTALIHEGAEEVVVVNIAGNIDPVILGSILANAKNLDLSGFVSSDSNDG